jgi:hypothetical protein
MTHVTGELQVDQDTVVENEIAKMPALLLQRLMYPRGEAPACPRPLSPKRYT